MDARERREKQHREVLLLLDALEALHTHAVSREEANQRSLLMEGDSLLQRGLFPYMHRSETDVARRALLSSIEPREAFAWIAPAHLPSWYR